ncbi:MAG: hypothetical protein L6R35_006558, partial [Caloplaca aegaea]
CFNVGTGDIENAPALDPLAKFEVYEKSGAVYIKGEEATIKASRRSPDVKCKAQGQEKIVVVGGGSGAMGAVQALREQGFKGDITMVSKEPNLPIDRTKLSKALIADKSKVEWRSQEWFDTASISTVSDEVSAIDFKSRSISTKSGKSLPYTKLILASGGTPKALPLPGFKDLSNIFLLRTLPDVQAILGAVGEDKGKNVVIIGSSFIGMEVANALSSNNTVTVVGMESAPLERVMGSEVGKIFQKLISNKGVKFHMGASVDSAQPSKDDKSKVGSVSLKDGTNLPADLVVLGIGVYPATEYLQDNSAIQLEKDGSLRTSESFQVEGLSDVYAIGDIATYPYHGPGGNGTLTRIEHWNVAQNAGRSVAASIAKPSVAPKPFIPVFWSAMGSQLRYCGNTPNGWDDLVLQGQPDEAKFAAFYGKGDTVVAVASMQMDPVMSQSAELMSRGNMPSMSELRKGQSVLERQSACIDLGHLSPSILWTDLQGAESPTEASEVAPMAVRIVLNDQRSWYTNLDVISGKIILSLPRRETITAITVKLEGESITHLVGDVPIAISAMGRRTHDEMVETEFHKVLYKVLTLLPTKDALPTTTGVNIIEAGVHEFSFQVKLPFNNSCVDADSTYVTLAGRQVQTLGNRERHVRKTLPPSLQMVHDQAIIRYYIKATVQRPAFYKENFRSEVSFPFFPIEPPRPPVPTPQQQRSETYSRNAHVFAPVAKSRGLFERKPVGGADVSSLLPPNVCIDGRLPDPPIITCNQPLPLKVLITKLNESSAAIHLHLLQIELVAKTRLRAHHLLIDNLTSTVIVSKSNMRTRLLESNNLMQIDQGHWSTINLPNNVAPSFETCNISRSYELRIKVGLQHGVDDHVFPELGIVTLFMSVQVFSGIAPPQALLQAMASHPHPPPRIPPRPHPPVTSTSTTAANLSPHPFHAAPPFPSQSQPAPQQQFQTGQTHPEEGPFPDDDAPPSYEEALAEGIAPVDGPRGVYSQGQGQGQGQGQQEAGNGGNAPPPPGGEGGGGKAG